MKSERFGHAIKQQFSPLGSILMKQSDFRQNTRKEDWSNRTDQPCLGLWYIIVGTCAPTVTAVTVLEYINLPLARNVHYQQNPSIFSCNYRDIDVMHSMETSIYEG
jgi:hypothetical protein